MKEHRQLDSVKLTEKQEKELFLQRLNETYAQLLNNKNAWQEELREHVLWDFMLQDGMEDVE